MKYLLALILILFLGCNSTERKSTLTQIEAMKNEIKNSKIKNYNFLKIMYDDQYFPNFLVDKGRLILLNLCLDIESQEPKELEELYKLTHKATDRFNKLNEEFGENESEIETVARDCIGVDFEYIANSYGYNADNEELIATREW